MRAALAIQRALASSNARSTGSRVLPSSLRASGSDSGPVVVDTTGEVFGEAPNVACARCRPSPSLARSSSPGAVQRQDRRPVRRRRPRRAHEPQRRACASDAAYRVVRAIRAGRRGSFQRALTPLASGAERSSETLGRRWERRAEAAKVSSRLSSASQGSASRG